MSSLQFDVSIETSKIISGFRDIQNAAKDAARKVESEGASMDKVFEGIGKKASLAFAGFSAGGIIKTLATVRGKYQQYQMALKTMLGSQELATQKMQEFAKLAAITPFGMDDVVSGAKQLMAYGIEQEKVTDTMRRLGDVAAGLGLNLKDLAWLYGTTATQGRLFTADFRQFTGRGIPLADELAKQFGVTKDKVQELVSAGKVGFPEVEKAIKAMTDEGGKFGGLMENQSKSITGQISNIEDTIEQAINTLGSQTEGLMNNSLAVVTAVVEHWQEVGEAITAAAAAIGIYKAEMLAVSAYNSQAANMGIDQEMEKLSAMLNASKKAHFAELQKAADSGTLTTEQEAELLAMKKETANAELQEAVASGKLTEAKAAQIAAMREEAAQYVTNLQLKAQAAADELTDRTAEVEAAEKLVNLRSDEYYKAVDANKSAQDALSLAIQNKDAADKKVDAAREYLDALKDTVDFEGGAGVDEYNAAADELKAAMTEQVTAAKSLETAAEEANTTAQAVNTAETNFNTASTELNSASEAKAAAATAAETTAKEANSAAQTVNTAATTRDSAAKNIWAGVVSLCHKAQLAWNASMFASPLFWIAAVIAGVAYAAYKLATATSSAEKATDTLNSTLEELADAQQKSNEETEKAISLAGDDEAATYDREDALSTLIAKYPEIIKKYIDEKGHLTDILKLKKEIAEFDGKKQRKETTDALKSTAEDAERAVELGNWVMKAENARRGSAEWKEFRKKYSEATGREVAVTNKEVLDYYKNLASQSRSKYNRTLTKDIISDFTKEGGKLEGYSDKALQALKKKLLDNTGKDKDNTSIYFKSIGDYLTQQDRKDLLTRVEGMLKSRGERHESSAGWGKDYKAEYDKAKKALDDFLADDSNSLSEVAFDKKRQELEDAVEAAKKKLNDPDKSKKSGKSGKDDSLRAQEQLDKELQSLQQKNSEEEVALMREGTDKKLAEVRNAYNKQKAELDKQKADFKKNNAKAGAAVGSDGLTNEQREALNTARLNADKELQKAEADIYKDDLAAQREAMQSYLKEYGNYQQRRLATAQEFEEKIAKAQTEGERLSLQAQMASALKSLDMENLKKSIDWDSVFNDLGNLTIDQLKKVKGQLKEMMEGGTLGLDEYQTAAERIGQVNEAIATAQDRTLDALGFINPIDKERKRLEQDILEAQEAQAIAAERLAKAKAAVNSKRQALAAILKTAGVNVNASDLTSADSQSVLDTVEKLFGKDSDAYKTVQSSFDDLAESERDLRGANEKAESSTKSLMAAQSKLTVFLNDFGNKLKSFANDMALVSANMQELPGLLEKFGVSGDSDFGKGVQQIADSVGSLNDAASNLSSGNFVGAISGIVSATESWWGGVSNLMFGSGNESKMEKEIAKLAESNELLATVIDDLKDAISDEDSTNTESLEAYRKAYKAQEEYNANMQKQIANRASEYSNGTFGIGGKSSFNKKAGGKKSQWLDAFNATLEANGYTGSISDVGDVWNLSAEELKVLRDFAPDAWEKFFNSGGYKNPEELVNDFIDSAGALDELTDALNEKLTGYSWSSFKDSYASALADMESETSDFADNINDLLTNAIVTSFINSDEVQTRIKSLYKMIADAAMDESDGGTDITKDEANAIRSANDELAEYMLAWRDKAINSGLLTSSTADSQSTTVNSTMSITEDTAKAIEGRMTAIQYCGEQTKAAILQQVELLTSLSASGSSQSKTLNDLLTQAALSNGYLADVVKYSKGMYIDFSSKLDKMNKQLENL